VTDRALRAWRESYPAFLTIRELSKENDRLFYHRPDVRIINVFLDLSRKESQ
jgi:hypothetical protein